MREFVCKKKRDKGAVRVVVHLIVANSMIGRSQLPLACWDCGVETGGADVCDVCKDKGTNKDKQDNETSTEKVQRKTREGRQEKKKYRWGHGSVPCECCFSLGKSVCEGPIPRSEESYRL